MSTSDSDSAHLEYRRERNGAIQFTASGTLSPADAKKILVCLNVPVEQAGVPPLFPLYRLPRLPNQFFMRLIEEINDAYSFGLYTSSYVCLRKLFENLIIELLRSKFGTSEVNLYYWTTKGRFHDFSVLIENFERKASDFKPYTSGFDQSFFGFLKKFKQRANRSAHSIEFFQKPTEIESIEDKIDCYLTAMCEAIRQIQSTAIGVDPDSENAFF